MKLPCTPLFITVFLAIFVAAESSLEVRSSSTITLPFVKRINTNGAGTINLVRQGQARAAALRERGAAVHFKRADNANVTNRAVSYITSVTVGSTSTSYDLIVDTGTANTWIGADKPYIRTSASVKTGNNVSMSYGTASFSGEVWIDTLVFGENFYGAMASIGVASQVTGFNPGVDGVLGLGPIGLTVGTVTNNPNATLPTITECLYDTSPGSASMILGISFAPPMNSNNHTGELTFGGPDPNRYTGKIVYVPITLTKPASNFWGIDQSITYGGKTILSQTAGVIDTGTTLILIASNAYHAYKSVTGGVEDTATGLLRLTTSQYDKLKNLNFNVYSQTYALTPNGQIWPRALNSYIGGSNGAIYLIVNNIGTPSGQGFDFINGQAFVERFYSVFDTVNWQIGLATTSYTNATTN